MFPGMLILFLKSAQQYLAGLIESRINLVIPIAGLISIAFFDWLIVIAIFILLYL